MGLAPQRTFSGAVFATEVSDEGVAPSASFVVLRSATGKSAKCAPLCVHASSDPIHLGSELQMALS